MLRKTRLRPLGEFAVVTAFNALTLGGALVLYGHAAGLGALETVAASHCTSATMSYAFCRFVVWRSALDSLESEIRAGAGFFALAGLSAAASLGATGITHSQSTSPYFVLLNYGAVGVITVGKFVVQRGLLTGRIPLVRGPHPRGAPRLLTHLANRSN